MSDKRKALVERHRRAVTEFLATIKMSYLVRIDAMNDELEALKHETHLPHN